VPVKEVFPLGPGHIVDIVESLLLDTDKSGLSISPDLVDRTANAAVKTALGSSYSAEFLIEEEINAKQWIEEEACRVHGLYPGIGERWKLVRIAADSAAADTITDDDIATQGENGPPLVSWDPNYSSIYNHVTIQYDWNSLTQKYETSKQFTDDASILLNGERPLVIPSKGLRTSLAGTTDLVAAIAARILARYANAASMVRATTQLKKNLIEPGDAIELTSAFVANMTTGTRGVTDELREVVSRNLAMSEGRVEFELMEV
jgi:hypothetical protein